MLILHQAMEPFVHSISLQQQTLC